MRETAAEKGSRYVAEGRLVVRRLDEEAGLVEADCRGDGTIWTLGRDGSGWWCSCPARWCSCPARGRCAHLAALGLVCALEPREAA